MSPPELALRRWAPFFRGLHTQAPSLMCYPPAGAGAAVFGRWPRRFGLDVEVIALNPPGRFGRRRDVMPSSMDGLLDQLAQVVASLARPSIALYGHSFGALVMFELARQLRSSRTTEVSHLFVAASPPPHAYRSQELTHLWRTELERFEASVTASAPVRRSVRLDLAAAMRADLDVLTTYVYVGGVVDLPVTLFLGRQDGTVRRDTAREWASVTSGPFRAVDVDGGHLFAKDPPQSLVEDVRDALAQT